MSRRLASALEAQLGQRRSQQLLRQLPLVDGQIDFCSNDYLGLARDPRLTRAIDDTLQKVGAEFANGSTGSRLISGNNAQVEALESDLASFHKAEAGLLFSTGYAANTGLFGCIVGDGDTLITDRLIHASIIDGVRLSKARHMRFRHNDLEHLRSKLERARDTTVIGVESIYSMDGDQAPLLEIVELAEQYGADVVVDEAHSVGAMGPAGAGLVVELGLQDRVFARVCTFGKALGLHGAVVVGSNTLRDYLVNFARPFIYSTAPPPHAVACIAAAYNLLPEVDDLREQLRERIRYFRERIETSVGTWLDSHSAIQSIVIPGNNEVREVAAHLRDAGLGVVPIVAPTVPKGSERIRLSVHAFNTESEIDSLFNSLDEVSVPWTDISLQA